MTIRVALTFDTEHPDRPHRAGTTEGVLATLARRNVRATFFVQGRWAEANPGTARAIVDGGHLVGHHSHYHARMPLLTDAGIVEDLRDGAAAIAEVTGVDPAPWFRCPFGAGADDPRVTGAIRTAGYRHVGWHVSADDWLPTRSGMEVADRIVLGVESQGDGAVVLLHPWPTATLEAIEPILDRLGVAGVELCRLDELPVVPVGVP